MITKNGYCYVDLDEFRNIINRSDFESADYQDESIKENNMVGWIGTGKDKTRVYLVTPLIYGDLKE